MHKLLAAVLFASAFPAVAGEMSSYEFNDFRGQYSLSDGRALTLAQHGRKFVAQIDGAQEKRIVPVSDSVFVADDGSYRLEFTRYQNGVVSAVRLVPVKA